MWDVWANAWQATSARENSRNSLARYGYTRRREQSEGRSGFPIAVCHGNGGWWKAAGLVSLFETRAFEFEHYGATAAGSGAS